jgi:hypothetical protein
MFVAQYDKKTGKVNWVNHAGGGSPTIASGISLFDNAIYVAGYFNGNSIFGKKNMTSYGHTDAFVIKCDQGSGEIQWSIQAGYADTTVISNSISVDIDGVACVSGNFHKRATFGEITIVAESENDNMFVAWVNEKKK